MARKLYVANLSFRTTKDQLRDLFSQAGEVAEAELVTERDSAASRGYGFVEMATEEGAQAAIAQFNGYPLDGHALMVREAIRQSHS
jgi:RNA recognition motif-containing protein